MFQFLRTASDLIKDWGAFGFGIVNFALMVFAFTKLFCNHLKHLKASVTNIENGLEEVEKKVDKNSIAISFIQGKLNNK